MMWSEKQDALKKITKKRDLISGITLIDLKQIHCVCNDDGEEVMNMFNLNEEFWHLDSIRLTFLTQTALIVCGATLERIQKTEFFFKRTGLKSFCVCKWCLFVCRLFIVQEQQCDLHTLLYAVA